MGHRFLILGLTVTLVSFGTACDQSRNESHDRPGTVPQTDQNEGAGIAAGHTKKNQKID